jgi:hypothetical protein
MLRSIASNATIPWLFDFGTRIWDKLAAALAIGVLSVWTWNVMLASSVDADKDAQQAEASEAGDPTIATPQREHMIAGYGGAPYIHPSDVTFSNPGVTDFTAHRLGWEGRPFKSPVYYGIRTLHWTGWSPVGGMIDFTHSKAISLKGKEVELSGMRNSQKMPPKAKVGDIFHHFEFSHGHNTLTANGMVRLANLVPRLAPYVGGGAGIAVPHTEVQFKGENVRTYEYQYVGPAGQGLIGLELRLPRVSVFIEYKFTLASYKAPMTNRDGGWFPGDLVRQLIGYFRGEMPAGGYLSTTLASHQVAAGVGVRVSRTP